MPRRVGGQSKGRASVWAAMGSRHRPQPKPGNNVNVFRTLTAAECPFSGGNEGGKNRWLQDVTITLE